MRHYGLGFQGEMCRKRHALRHAITSFPGNCIGLRLELDRRILKTEYCASPLEAEVQRYAMKAPDLPAVISSTAPCRNQILSVFLASYAYPKPVEDDFEHLFHNRKLLGYSRDEFVNRSDTTSHFSASSVLRSIYLYQKSP